MQAFPQTLAAGAEGRSRLFSLDRFLAGITCAAFGGLNPEGTGTSPGRRDLGH